MQDARALGLTCSLSTPRIPAAGDPRLVYLLLEVSGEVGSVSLPVNLALVVDVSESMHFRLATEEQFRELARRGVLRETLVDGAGLAVGRPSRRTAGRPATQD